MVTHGRDGAALALAAELVRRHEGLRLRVYDDATGLEIRPGTIVRGRPTIGWGRNLLDPGITEAEADAMLEADLRRAQSTAEAFAGDAWAWLDDRRRAAVIDMAFNLGGRLMSFRRFRAALLRGDYPTAAREMLDSLWARQVGRRAETLARIMRGDAGGAVAWATGTGAAITGRGQ